jgi:hypothetical protein
MPVKRKIVSLSVSGNSLLAADTDAGVSGEDGAVWLHAQIPEDWQDLNCVLQVIAENGNYDVSGTPVSGIIDMPLRQGVTVPGKLVISLIGTTPDGVRKSIDCKSLSVTQSDTGGTLAANENPVLLEQLIEKINTAAASVSDSAAAAAADADTAVAQASGAGMSAINAENSAERAKASENNAASSAANASISANATLAQAAPVLTAYNFIQSAVNNMVSDQNIMDAATQLSLILTSFLTVDGGDFSAVSTNQIDGGVF